MHWMRVPIAPSIDCETARASTVFAVPGTSSKRTWPLQASAVSTSRISSRLPWTTVSMFAEEPVGDLDGLAQLVGLSQPRQTRSTSVVAGAPAARSDARLGVARREQAGLTPELGRLGQDLELAGAESLAADLAHHGSPSRVSSRRDAPARRRRASGGCAALVTPPIATTSRRGGRGDVRNEADRRAGAVGADDRDRPGKRLERRRAKLVGDRTDVSLLERSARRHTARCELATARRSSSDSCASSRRETSARMRSQNGPMTLVIAPETSTTQS